MMMIVQLLVSCIMIVLCATYTSHAEDSLQGIVNRYMRVIAMDSCAGSIIVDPPPTLNDGDRIILHQVKGAVIDTSDTNVFGTIIDMKNAGRFEYLTVFRSSGNTIFVTTDIRNTYDLGSSVQCIAVAHHTTARIVNDVIGSPWDGVTGGVAAIDCDDTLFLDAPVSAARRGFRGGAASVNRPDTNATAWVDFENAGTSGRKGESCVVLPARFGAGRGSNATGGGGGNARNGGGGGGAIASTGGRGGNQTSEFPAFDAGGRGGNGIIPSSTDVRMLLGGGGGGGHQNDLSGTDGGSGGGIVIIRARVVVASARGLIDISGQDALTSSADGAGGGGSAGSVIFDVGSAQQPVPVIATGGNGGDANGTSVCYAPGGGGSGGLIMLTASSGLLQSDVQRQFLGGRAGVFLGQASECPDQSNFGATPGSLGAVTRVGDVPRPASAIVHYSLTPRDTVVCEGDDVALRISGATSARWIDSQFVVDAKSMNTRSQRIDSSITVAVDVVTLRGCVARDTVRITVIPRPRPRIVYATTLLTPTTPVITLSVDAPYQAYTWRQGELTSAIDVSVPGRYWVTVIDSNGCAGISDTVVIRSILDATMVHFSVQDATIIPGAQTRVAVRLVVDDTLDNNVDVDVDLHTRATMLIPNGGAITGTTPDVKVSVLWTEIDEENGLVHMRLRWTLGRGDARQRTVSFPFQGALGDSVACAVSFSNCITSDDAVICAVDRQGRARMDTLCVQDARTRLFNPFATVDVQLLGNTIRVSGDVGSLNLRLIDVLGRSIEVQCTAQPTTMICVPPGTVTGAHWWCIEHGGRLWVVPVMLVP